jgi:hypothetical protein
MEIALQIASIGLVVLGGLIALFNGWVLVNQLRGRHVPSVAPFVGGLMLFGGVLLYPDSNIRKLALLGLVVDYGCLPYFVLASISVYRESRRHAAKNRLLELAIETPNLIGSVLLYPGGEAILEYAMRDGMQSGSITMKARHDAGMREMEIANNDVSIRFARFEGGWTVQEERGWKNQKMSLFNASVQERQLTNKD